MSNNKKESTIFSDLSTDFIIEFFAYNISNSDIVKKVYVKLSGDLKETSQKRMGLDEGKLKLISQAFDNKLLSSFNSDRYSLYDISFRESSTTNSIGFSFNDLKDSSYIEPERAFQMFSNFGITPIVETVKKIQKSMFRQQPNYNPISMIGLALDDDTHKRIKAYIRYDLSETPTMAERIHIVKRIIKAINPNKSSEEFFSKVVQRLENLGFMFYFIGVDCNSVEKNSYKLYFKFTGHVDSFLIGEEIALIMFEFGLHNNVKDIFNKHNSGMWGLAISTDSFENVNGIQLYFYP